MSRKVMLDTNAYVHLHKGSASVLDAISEAERVYVPVIVLGELFAGFRGGTNEQKNKSLLKRFLQKPTVRVLHTTEDTAEVFADVFNQLKASGNRIPTNDIWIAAHALENGSALITFDHHFEHVAGLRRWR